MDDEASLKRELEESGGILRLRPNYVPQVYPGLDRLGLENANAGNRGFYSERWLASCVDATSETKEPNEGLGRIWLEHGWQDIFLRDAFDALPDEMLGRDYARSHDNRLGILTTVLDIGYPIPLHIHARRDDAWRYWRLGSKEEAYFFLPHERSSGPLPYSHLGLHPGTAVEDVLTPLKHWNDDSILNLSPAYRLNVGEGFHTRAGVPHAPGTALTLECAEASDVYNFLQAKYMGHILSKQDFLLRGLPGEEEVTNLIDWEASTDPEYYRHNHIFPEEVDHQPEGECLERWIFPPARTSKFSGKELRVGPHKTAFCTELGPHPLLVWSGSGSVGERKVSSNGRGMDELFITHSAATQGYKVTNSGDDWLVLYKTFGPYLYSTLD